MMIADVRDRLKRVDQRRDWAHDTNNPDERAAAERDELVLRSDVLSEIACEFSHGATANLEYIQELAAVATRRA